MNLELTVEEAQAIIQVLGELPTKTGAYNLMMKISQQVQSTIGDAVPTE